MLRVLDFSISRYPKSQVVENSEMKFDQNFDLAIQSSLRCWSSLPACLPSNEQAYLRTASDSVLTPPDLTLFLFCCRCILSSCQAIIVVVLAINDKHTLSVKHANMGKASDGVL
jgi:hypothetical protein